MADVVRTRAGQGLERLLDAFIPAHAPAGQLVALVGGRRVLDAFGEDAIENGGEISGDTLFDIASITKVFTAVAFMRLVEAGHVALDDPIRTVFPEAAEGVRPDSPITWRELLTHTSGLPAGVDLRTAVDPGEARTRVLAVEPAAGPGAGVVYSDVGFIVLGFGIERLFGESLQVAIRILVTEPLRLERTQFRPSDGTPVVPTEICPWRGRRLSGEVHDENAAALGGVAGHAGLFSTAREIAALGEALRLGGSPILKGSTVAEMTRQQATDGSVRRGLGLSLWSPDPGASSHPFGPGTYGHTGFTGTSVWVDPDRELVVALLTNAVHRGREDRGFSAARISLHRQLLKALDGPEGRQGGS